MRVLRKTLYTPNRSQLWILYHLTDVHLGNAACDEKLFRADVQAIADDEFAIWGGGGDMIDGIGRRGDRRYREDTLAKWLHGETDVIDMQIQRFLDIIRPIAHKCQYFLTGNHEDDLLAAKPPRNAYLEMLRGIANIGNIKIHDIACGWEGVVELRFRRGTPEKWGGTSRVLIYTHHGAGGGRKKGGHALRMEEVLDTHQCDIALVGHRHHRDSINKAYMAVRGGKVRWDERHGVWGGSYLMSTLPSKSQAPPSHYPQKKQLPPQVQGIVPIIIKPDAGMIMPVTASGPNAARDARLLAGRNGEKEK